jgi:hypothetical protein
VHDLDRLSRKLTHQLLLSEEFEQAGVALHVVTMPAGAKTPETQLLSNVRALSRNTNAPSSWSARHAGGLGAPRRDLCRAAGARWGIPTSSTRRKARTTKRTPQRRCWSSAFFGCMWRAGAPWKPSPHC